MALDDRSLTNSFGNLIKAGRINKAVIFSLALSRLSPRAEQEEEGGDFIPLPLFSQGKDSVLFFFFFCG